MAGWFQLFLCPCPAEWNYRLTPNRELVFDGPLPTPFSHAFQRPALIGLSCVFSTECRVPRVHDNEGVLQPILLPIQRRPVEHRNQHLHTRWSLPCCAAHTHDLFRSDQPDAGVLCCQEFPGGGATVLPPGGVGLGSTRFLAKSARTPERRVRMPGCTCCEWGLTWGLARQFHGGLGYSVTGLAGHLRRLPPHTVVSLRQQRAARELDFLVHLSDRIFSLFFFF